MSCVIVAESGATVVGPFASGDAARAWAADRGLELDGEGSWLSPLIAPEADDDLARAA